MSNQQKSAPRRPMAMGPGGRGHGPGEKAKNFKGTMKNLLNYLKPFYLKIFIVIIFAVGSTVFAIIGPKILGQATTKLSEGIMAKVMGTGGIDFDAIWNIILLLIALYAISAIFSLSLIHI